MRTSRYLIALILLVQAAGPAVAAALSDEPLTLAQALTRALEHNPELAVDAPMRESARLEAKASRATYLPRVDFEQSYTGGNNPVYVFGTLLTQRRFTAGNFSLPSLNQPDPIDNLQTRFTAQGVLWDFGRSRQRVEGAELGIELADRGHDEHVRQVLLSTLDAYLSVSLAREAWNAARVSLETGESIVKQAQARVGAGMAIEADLLRGQVYLAAARQREIEYRGQLEMARSRLNQLMGLPETSPLGETSSLKPTAMTVPTEEALKAEQRNRRPDYQRLAAEIRQAELELRSRQSEFLPSIGAYASWEMDNPSLSSYGGNNWLAGLSLRWNVFAGGADAARTQAARQRLEAKKRQLAAMESGMSLEIHNALIQFRSVEQQVDAARAAEAQSEEGLRILKNRYDAGLATMTDVLSAESQRAAARAMLSEAVYRQRLSFARIEYAAGTLSPTSTVMNP